MDATEGHHGLEGSAMELVANTANQVEYKFVVTRYQ